ncbi:TetR/AcrR family transcriptional regulator [Methylovirgula sp. 4M-Z18]|uniref:TetR/AcrR family transcriptional regulator n=1 Tax=Methylovirgula sp. 4M-Z18 TaxID=2293567 RepID=UPI000E2F3C71|nr:TetR/AcrR family transcriptional regulator [Methylovirgula sp. 4M-Z18]RFB78800.1 TetR/AcrR family transcriptional regulator [Methylovirgula sp. 4M-Z18]
MARPLSEQKREAILAAATELVATQGVGAPTAKIAQSAGLAEGTLFKYFATKDELLNQLYLAIKADLADAMLKAYPAEASVVERARHVWGCVIDWGAKYPLKRRAMRQLTVSDRVTAETRKIGAAAFHEVSAMLDQCASEGLVAIDAAGAFAGAIFDALAETTLEFIAREPKKKEHYKSAGFKALWNGVAG